MFLFRLRLACKQIYVFTIIPSPAPITTPSPVIPRLVPLGVTNVQRRECAEAIQEGACIQLKKQETSPRCPSSSPPATHFASYDNNIHVAFLGPALLDCFLFSGSTLSSPSSGPCKCYSFCLEHSSLPPLSPLLNIFLDILQTRKCHVLCQWHDGVRTQP